MKFNLTSSMRIDLAFYSALQSPKVLNIWPTCTFEMQQLLFLERFHSAVQSRSQSFYGSVNQAANEETLITNLDALGLPYFKDRSDKT